MALIDGLERVQKAEGETERVRATREFHRKASWYVDFLEAENSTGFHAPQEAARPLQLSVDHARQGQLALSMGTTRSAATIRLSAMRNPVNKGPDAVTAPAAPAPTPARTTSRQSSLPPAQPRRHHGPASTREAGPWLSYRETRSRPRRGKYPQRGAAPPA